MTPEQEFRKLIFDELKEIRKDVGEVKNEMLTLKIKVALFSSLISTGITYFFSKLFHS